MRIMLSTILLLTLPWSVSAEDIVEFTSGAKVTGTVKEIRKDKREFDFQMQLGGRTLQRTYKFSAVRAVTMNGQRYPLSDPAAEAPAGDANGSAARTPTQLLALVEQAGRQPPDWFDATPLDHPKTLDLSWPLKPVDTSWNNEVNVGQYLWDIIYPNPGRWKSGVRLVHHVMELHRHDPPTLQRDTTTLGSMYFQLFQDYPRAAFWLRQAKLAASDPHRIMLAECYWRLGNEPMALEILSAPRLPLAAVKLLGDMGQTDRALKLAEAFARQGSPQEAYLLAGDACRLAGKYPQATGYYKKVIDAPDARNEEYTRRYRNRAAESLQAMQLFDQADASKLADGTYRAASEGYNGQIEVEVAVREGRISDVRVTQHQEKQFYSALTDTTQQIIQKQSVKNIDATSRATITSQAIVNATAKALAGGTR
ncbi:MAG: FMN-binding protein [Pirellulaceae bacterium]